MYSLDYLLYILYQQGTAFITYSTDFITHVQLGLSA